MLLCLRSLCKHGFWCSSFYPVHTCVPPPNDRQLQNHRQIWHPVLGKFGVFAECSNKADAVSPASPRQSLQYIELKISAQTDKGTEDKALKSAQLWGLQLVEQNSQIGAGHSQGGCKAYFRDVRSYPGYSAWAPSSRGSSAVSTASTNAKGVQKVTTAIIKKLNFTFLTGCTRENLSTYGLWKALAWLKVEYSQGEFPRGRVSEKWRYKFGERMNTATAFTCSSFLHLTW